MDDEANNIGIAEQGADPSAAESRPQNETESKLTRIWEDLLNIKSVGTDQNFFDLGGDSSVAVRMFAEIEKIFKVNLPLATLYESSTIKELARVITSDSSMSS